MTHYLDWQRQPLLDNGRIREAGGRHKDPNTGSRKHGHRAGRADPKEAAFHLGTYYALRG
ncbi:hypothetical protein GSH01_20595 [Burkholderia pseudomallei]|nr:hypothetical protein [Burkholderia pseudomallei]